MIHILENSWANSCIGLGFIIIMLIINLILIRRQTIFVAVTNQLVFGLLSWWLFGWQNIIYGSIALIVLIALRYRNRYFVEGSSLDFSNRIFSFHGFFNKLQKPGKDEIIVGNIMPTHRSELKYNMKPLAVDDTVLSGATLLTGATGSGKTTTMKSMMMQAIDHNKPVVFFDYKGETDILDELQEYCEKRGVPFYEFSTRTCSFSYDPLVNLNATGKVEALMNTRRWDASGADEHYKTSTQLAIQNLVQAYDKYRKQKSEDCNYLVGLQRFAYGYKPEFNERDGYNTLVKQLEILMSSRAKDMLSTDKEKFTFEREEPFVICFSFISANKALANSLSSFIYQDIMDRGTRKHYNPKLLLYIDEFGTLESSTLIKDILEKGRSGGCQTIFSILDINQIAMTAGDHFVNAILGTINSFIIHAGATQQTADLLAGVQKWDNKAFSIMDLSKPYKGKPPTALFICKYALINKRGNQEMYRIIPYVFKDKKFKPNQSASDKRAFDKSSYGADRPLLNGKPIEMAQGYKETEQEYEELEKPTIINNVDDFL